MRSLATAWIALATMAGTGMSPVARAQAGPSGPQIPPGFKVGYLFDPMLGMNAYGVAYPEKWHMRGLVWQGSQCNHRSPSQVFRVTSPDGLMMLERLPILDWSWRVGERPPWMNTGQQGPDGCLPVREYLSAKDFLKYLAGVLQVQYVGEWQLPDTTVAKFNRSADETHAFWANKYRSFGMEEPDFRAELAAADVRFQNGSYTMKGRLVASVDCQSSPTTYGRYHWYGNQCHAAVRYTVAPEGRFDSAWKAQEKISAFPLPQWTAAWQQKVEIQREQTNAMIDARSQAQMQANQQQFQQQMAVQQIQHDQFLAQMQHSTDMSIQNAEQIAARQKTITSDWVDYSLGQQTVRDPTTGEIAKVQAGPGNTWRNGNLYYQTYDPNANPNGVLQGTWNQQQITHGDGTP